MDKNDEILTDGIDERIETFLRGEMSAEEEAAFKQDIRRNPELRSRAMTMISLIKGLQGQNSTREATIIKENKVQSRVRPIFWWVCSVAAVFAIFLGIYKEHRYSMLDEIVSTYYTEYDISNVSRGDVDSTEIAHLYVLFSQIRGKRNISDIIKELEPIYNSLDDNFTYYAFANDIAWNLALAYVKDDQIVKAISILQKLKEDNPDTPIYKKADELLKKLSDL